MNIFLQDLIKRAGEIALKKNGKLKIDLKGKNDIVTDKDIKIENFLIREILKKYPDHSFLAEEETFKNKNLRLDEYKKTKFIWIIDPIDGTQNFACNFPLYGISIAVFAKSETTKSKNFNYMSGELLMGAIYIPEFDQLFFAEKGKGAFLNGKKIRVSNTEKLEESMLSTCLPEAYKKFNVPKLLKAIDKVRSIRLLGAASIDLAYMATGFMDGVWIFGAKPWDIAAGVLIVKEAGGEISDSNGNLLDLFGKDLLATNGKIHKSMIKMLASA